MTRKTTLDELLEFIDLYETTASFPLLYSYEEYVENIYQAMERVQEEYENTHKLTEEVYEILNKLLLRKIYLEMARNPSLNNFKQFEKDLGQLK